MVSQLEGHGLQKAIRSSSVPSGTLATGWTGRGDSRRRPTSTVRLLELLAETVDLLAGLLDVQLHPTAYDTAWIARVPNTNGASTSAFPEALEWLRRNQRPNGSWGGQIQYYHDLVISTLSAVITLAKSGGGRDVHRIRRGTQFLRRNLRYLHLDPCEMVGFELILPTLLQEAKALGLDIPYNQCERYHHLRAEKLRLIPAHMIYSRDVTTAHSLEFMGSELDVTQIPCAQEENGSLGNSPSATAYLLAEHGDDAAARAYVSEAVQANGGAVPPLYPVEVFNLTWSLYNLHLAGLLRELPSDAKPLLDYLFGTWNPDRGIGFSRHYSVPDLDDTAIGFLLLTEAGYDVGPDVLLQFEKDDHFMCFPFERTPSIGVHIHLVDALRTCPGYVQAERMIDKAAAFYRSCLERGAWIDKWHASPFYPLAHAAIASIGHDDDLATMIVESLLNTQHQDGGWGYFGSTSEETAFCLQALLQYHRRVRYVDQAVLYHGVQFLYDHLPAKAYPPLWIDKCLYAPVQIIRSAILSALWMYETL